MLLVLLHMLARLCRVLLGLATRLFGASCGVRVSMWRAGWPHYCGQCCRVCKLGLVGIVSLFREGPDVRVLVSDEFSREAPWFTWIPRPELQIRADSRGVMRGFRNTPVTRACESVCQGGEAVS